MKKQTTKVKSKPKNKALNKALVSRSVKHGNNCKFTHTMCDKCYIEYIEWSCRD